MARPLLCATVLEPTLARATEVMALAAVRADLLEVRLDTIADPDVETLVAAATRPLVLTCRSREDGGGFAGDEASRLDLLRRGIAAGVPWVDVEVRAAERLGDRGETRVIVSHHDPAGTPSDPRAILREMDAHAPDVRKLVTLARGPEDVLRILRLLEEEDRPLAAHTMGEAGFPGRVLAARFGTAILYGAARAGAPGAPGQVTLRELMDDYGLDRDLEAAKVLVLLGGDLRHSVSPRMMNRTFLAEGIEALYLPWALSDPEPVLAAFGELCLAGAAVTIPLKERVRELVGDLDPTAARVGAVNTVAAKEDRLLGYNTDLGGALGALRDEVSDLLEAHAVLVGAGGAARAIAHGLREAGARVTLVNRTHQRAEALAAKVGGVAGRIKEVDPEGVDILVNATPVGQWPAVGEMPVPADFLRPRHVVFDAVYNPRETLLLRTARRLGCRVIPGIEMLARQAALQLEIWHSPVPLERLRAEGVAALDARHSPILLIGMRGSGKSTAGRLVAERLGRPFVDLDEVVERRERRTIPEIFAEDGEARFRQLEREALGEEIRGDAVVLALGGGALLDSRSRELVGSVPARVVFLSADAGVLAERIRGSDRPSLTGAPLGEEVSVLLARRESLYREVADSVVDAGAGPESVADRILEALGY